MFERAFETVLASPPRSSTVFNTADVQRVYDDCRAQGIPPEFAVSETEDLCNVRKLIINAYGQVVAYQSH